MTILYRFLALFKPNSMDSQHVFKKKYRLRDIQIRNDGQKQQKIGYLDISFHKCLLKDMFKYI